jgi:hypothetical protein
MLQKKAVGSDLYEQVFYSLDLIEKDYFGLQYTDANNVQVSCMGHRVLLWLPVAPAVLIYGLFSDIFS